ncbi:LOW QUALITY PROTEIN: V-set and immunoglobulin domain-containing protein 1-like [Gymnodraco acuticeps]|uniref:LOW QUALITY PROTEIN: V-set and immunoglobulin domain-containing protein 1-like n=1 Tax=Gymnodraco acuticeps TaxID=8218 RepID=UPI001471BD2F|nr:LOW QUALITY PROTEIN: V-set and immunoglobulin domain-containing protein 1-like [Gymnodraco acuticeps]
MCSTMSLLVLLSIIGCVELIKVSTPHKYVNVTRGTDVLLPCTFVTSAPDTKKLNIQWDFVATSSAIPKPVYYYLSGTVDIATSYEGRVQPPFSPATTKNASIIIRNIQPSDTGVYSCQVHNLPDFEGVSEADIFVLVFETPSTPYCSVHGDVESGHLVTLTCHSERGSPPPTYTWIRLDQARTRRPVMGRTTDTGILEIRNISQFEFGEYQCNATNGEGFSTCTLELNHDVGDGVIAGAVIGALLGCVLIVLVVWFIAHTLKKHKYKAIKASEGNEMMRSSTQAPEASDSVTMATTPSNLHAEGDGPKA